MSHFITVDENFTVNGMYLDPHPGAIEVTKEQWNSIGPDFKYVNGEVIAPPEKSEEEKRLELIRAADEHKLSLHRDAEIYIGPLSRAKSLGIATKEELESLSAWEMYSVLLMRVDTSLAPNIEWPQKPQ